jgi:hypothetical protein
MLHKGTVSTTAIFDQSTAAAHGPSAARLSGGGASINAVLVVIMAAMSRQCGTIPLV